MKKVYKIAGMHCSSCALDIEWTLEDAGIKAKCDYAQETLEVEGEANKETLKKTVEKLGYKLLPLP